MARAAQGTSGPAENKKTGPREDLERKTAGKASERPQEGREAEGVRGRLRPSPYAVRNRRASYEQKRRLH